jgi:Zn-dependent protease with chaperone function
MDKREMVNLRHAPDQKHLLTLCSHEGQGLIIIKRRFARAAPKRIHGAMPTAFRAMSINDRPAWTALFSNHPPSEEHIAALQALGR